MILLSWAKQQVWWPVILSLLEAGATALVTVPELPPGTRGLLRKKGGGAVMFVADPTCPAWAIQHAAPESVREWLLGQISLAPARTLPDLPYLSRFVEVGEA